MAESLFYVNNISVFPYISACVCVCVFVCGGGSVILFPLLIEIQVMKNSKLRFLHIFLYVF